MKYLYIIIIVFLSFHLKAQRADKVYKQFEKKDFIKAEEQFLKILEKDTANCAANFGLAYIYSTEDIQMLDYFKAWDYFRVAYRNQDKLDEDEAEAIKLHIAQIDPRRRSKPLKKNFDLEKDIIQDKLITHVREENNLEVALRFIQEYPTSDFIENVYHIRNYIEFRTAEDANTVAGYNLFLQKYPDAAQVETVIKLRNKKAFAEAKATNSLKAIETFIARYPDAEEIFEAESMRNKLAFVEAKKANNLQAIEAYIENYPNATEVAEAMQIKRQLLFEQAKSINTLEAYNNFVKLYPEGKQFVDIFNLKANVLGNTIKENNQVNIPNAFYYKGFDRNQMDDVVKDICILNDKIIVAGKTRIEENNWDAWVIAIDNDGKMLWNKSFGKAFDDQVKTIAVAENGNIYLGGFMNAMGDSIKGIAWLVSMTKNGDINWSKTLKATKIKSIAIDAAENIYAGGSYSDSSGFKYQLFKLDNNGETLWTRKYITTGEVEAVHMVNDSSLLFSGSNWIVHLSADGYILHEKMFQELKDPVLSVCNNGQYFYAGKKDSLTLQYGALSMDMKEIWSKSITLEQIFRMDDFSASYASMQLLLNGENAFYLYDFDFEGTETSHNTITKQTFTKRAIYTHFNGKSIFSSTAETFGQKDMFLVKFQ